MVGSLNNDSGWGTKLDQMIQVSDMTNYFQSPANFLCICLLLQATYFTIVGWLLWIDFEWLLSAIPHWKDSIHKLCKYEWY